MITKAIFVSFQSYRYHTLFVKDTKIEIPSVIILDSPSHKQERIQAFFDSKIHLPPTYA